MQKRRKEQAEKRKRDLQALDLGGRMRKRRKELGLTLEKLAELTDMSPNYLGSVERGTVDPSHSTIRAIARGLDLAPGALVSEPPVLSSAALEFCRGFDHDLSREMAEICLTLLRQAHRELSPGPPGAKSSEGENK
jgi:transcriptional regulator with XRE-family HTH domain